jgi:glycerophosphoryl diester phosphodiesterase
MFIIGHRGARAVEPENTLRALRAGMRCSDYVEIDVRLSRDMTPVIMHDALVDRTTDGKGLVSDQSLGELRSLDAGQGERIPTLEDVCREVQGRCGLIVELKEPGSEERVCRVLSAYQLQPLWIVSFHGECIRAARDLCTAARSGLIFSRFTPDTLHEATDLGVDAILAKFGIVTRDLVHAAHHDGMLVISWTLNNPEEFRKAEELGIDGLASDDPCQAREYFSGKAKPHRPPGLR